MLIIGEDLRFLTIKMGAPPLLLHIIIRGKQRKVFPIVILHYEKYALN